MSIPIEIGGETFQLPTRREKGWSDELNAIIVALNDAIEADGGGGASFDDGANPEPIGSVNTGNDAFAARRDHVHAHGNQLGGTLHSAADPSTPGFLAALDKRRLLAMGVYPCRGGGTTDDINTALAAMRTAGLSQLLLEGTYTADCGGLDDWSSLVDVEAGERIIGLGYGRTVVNIINTTQGAGEFGVYVFRILAGANEARVNGIHFVGDNGTPDGTGFTYVLNNLNICIGVQVSIVTPTRHLDFSDNYFECLWGFSLLDAQGYAFDDGGNAFIRAVGNTYRYCANGVNLNGSFGEYDGDFFYSEGYEISGAFNHVRGRFKNALGVACTIGGFQEPDANFPGNIVEVSVDGCSGAGVTITDGAHGTQVTAYCRHCDDGGLIINGSVAPPRGVVIRGVFVSNCKDPGSNLNAIFLNTGDGHQLVGVQCYDNGDAGFAQGYGLNVVCPNVQVWGGFFGGNIHDISVGNDATNFRMSSNVALENNSIEFIGTSTLRPESLTGKAATDLVWTTRWNSGSGLPERAYFGVAGNGDLYWNDNLDLLKTGADRSSLRHTAANQMTLFGSLIAGGFQGPLTGNVTGNVTGNLSGNVTGNVTGAVTGNASTATALATARNIAGVAFDGTSNINVPFSGLTGGIDDTQHGNRGGGTLHADVVTGGASGFMTGAQATKLAGIATGATAEVDAADGVAGRVNTAATQRLGDGIKEVDALGIVSNTVPSAPSAGFRTYYKRRARTMPQVLGDYGFAYGPQPFLGNRSLQLYQPQGIGGTTMSSYGGAALTLVGTQSAPTLSNASMYQAAKRIILTGAAGAGSASSARDNSALKYQAGARYGLHFCARFALTTAPSGRIWRCGFGNTTGTYGATVEPSADAQVCWVGQNSNSSFIEFYTAGATNPSPPPANKTRVASSLSSPGTSDLLEVHIFFVPNASELFMSVEKLNTGDFAEFQYTTGVSGGDGSSFPSAGLNPHIYHSNNATGSSATTELLSLYIETDF